MNEKYINIKKTQISFFDTIPLYYFSSDGQPCLYKKEGITFPKSRVQSNSYPDLFIRKSDQRIAYFELQRNLNKALYNATKFSGFEVMKELLCELVEEALRSPLEYSLHNFPETLEILFKGYSENKMLLKSLIRISGKSSHLIDHTVNILSITLQYCFYHNLSESDIKLLGICALLHDIGSIELQREIVESEEMLTDDQFEIFKTHTLKGFKFIKKHSYFESDIALVALEHHEKIDGSGYPNGKTAISEISQLIGIIDSYEPLNYRSKSYRQAKKPFNSLQILKDETIKGQYDKKLFTNLCSSLT